MKFQKIKLYNTKDFEHRTPKGTKIKYFCISMTELWKSNRKMVEGRVVSFTRRKIGLCAAGDLLWYLETFAMWQWQKYESCFIM